MNACTPKDYPIPGVDSMPAALAPPRQPTPLHLAPGGGNTVARDGDGGRWPSNAGRVLRTESDAPLGRTRALAAVLPAARAPRRIPCTPAD
jgi:hypothetical protein